MTVRKTWETVPSRKIIHYADIGYSVIIWPFQTTLTGAEPTNEWSNAVVMDFCVYEHCSFDEEKNIPAFNKAGSSWGPNCVENPVDAEIFAEGSVKWDGCSNFIVGEEGLCIHKCDRQSLENMGVLFARIWDEAARNLDESDCEVGDTE